MFVEAQLILIFIFSLLLTSIFNNKIIKTILSVFLTFFLIFEIISYYLTDELIDYRFFIHADTKLHIENIKEIKCFINKENIHKVGFFHLKFNNSSVFAYFISKWANFRSKFFNMPFGDQCLLINRLYYESIGGYEEIDKMEDMEIMLKIPNKNKFFFKSYIETSFNKYKNNGILTQSFKNIFNQIFFLLR